MDLEDLLHDTVYGAPRQNRRSKAQRVDVEVILMSRTYDELNVRLTEDSKPVKLPSSGVQIINRNGKHVELRLSERKAINYNLI